MRLNVNLSGVVVWIDLVVNDDFDFMCVDGVIV